MSSARNADDPPSAPGSVVAQILAELSPEARLVDLARTGGGYEARVTLPGEVGETLSLPRSLVESAPGDGKASTALRGLLRPAVRALRSRRAIRDARETPTDASADPICPACRTPIPSDAAVAVIHGEMLHRPCAEGAGPG